MAHEASSSSPRNECSNWPTRCHGSLWTEFRACRMNPHGSEVLAPSSSRSCEKIRRRRGVRRRRSLSEPLERFCRSRAESTIRGSLPSCLPPPPGLVCSLTTWLPATTPSRGLGSERVAPVSSRSSSSTGFGTGSAIRILRVDSSRAEVLLRASTPSSLHVKRRALRSELPST